MSGSARNNSHCKPSKSRGMQAQANITDMPDKPNYSTNAWPTNDNKPSMWHAVISWTVICLGIAGFVILAAMVFL